MKKPFRITLQHLAFIRFIDIYQNCQNVYIPRPTGSNFTPFNTQIYLKGMQRKLCQDTYFWH